jgi:uncharacterized cupin superfamily protein
MAGPVLNVADAEGFPIAPQGGSEVFGARLAKMGDVIGLRQLGCMLHEVEPGKRAFPYHNHHGNEELFVVLSGSGEVRIGAATHPVRAGDVVACPAGGPETAHQIVNSGTATLRYLGISTMKDPEVVEYPDSGKFGVLAIGEGNSFATARLRYIGRADSGLDYWDGES